ncbi:MAG: Protein lysine acetyltransferase Pat [Elusimicrobia bacterium]|nr:Protein lysine acetyltransferase Pat [Elusimicrobiota bacterium]
MSQQSSITQDLSRVLSPRSVAVVGASRKEGSVGDAIFRNLLASDFQGVLYPVNPKAPSIGGVKCYPTLSAIQEPIDLAIIIVPNTVVPDVLKECAAAHIPGAVVVSAGFKEIGGKGIELEREIKAIAEEHGIALIGPNCLGFINTDSRVRLNASFAATMPKAGNIAFISQSGALCTAVLDYAKGKGIGFSKFVSMGNKALVNELDFLTALRDDPMTDVILMYVEDIADGQEFIRLARHITGETLKPKPIIAIKSGRTPEGAKAASSHTGSLAGSDDIYDAVFLQSGVLRVETVEELFDYAVAFSQQPLPKGNRVAIVTNAGGPGIMATDAAIRHGLELAKLDASTIESLKKELPITANVNNPVDVIGDARHDRYEAAIRAVVKDPNVDGVVVILTPQAMTDIREIGEVVARVAESMKISPWLSKPILASFMGIVDVSVGVSILEKAGIPHYIFPEGAVRALSQMHRYQKNWLDRPRTEVKIYPVQKELVEKIFKRVKSEGRTYLPEVEALEVFAAYGLPVLKSKLVKSEEEAIQTAKEFGYPVVLKIASPAIVHKLDAGGVVINIRDAGELTRAYRKMINTAHALVGADKVWGAEVQQMADKGVEVFMGSKRDPKFGPVIVFGLGGTFVEVFRDVSFRLAPLREWTTRAIIEKSKAYKILQGYRGQPADIAKVSECLGRLSQLVVDFPEIKELDINPLIVYPLGNGARVLDGRIVLSGQ